jgi:minor histocompatibility antigen H13
MLGLGDIVIPGIFISLALRYDFASYVSRVLKKNPKATPRKEDSYSKPYFWTVLLAYILGLTTTVVVMHTYKAAQPALLYLSPACSTFRPLSL